MMHPVITLSLSAIDIAYTIPKKGQPHAKQNNTQFGIAGLQHVVLMHVNEQEVAFNYLLLSPAHLVSQPAPAFPLAAL